MKQTPVTLFTLIDSLITCTLLTGATPMHNYYKNKQILVTGGAGFIGSYVTELLVAKGAQVTVLDNLSTGNLANIAHVRDKIIFIKGSITDMHTCLDATQGTAIA